MVIYLEIVRKGMDTLGWGSWIQQYSEANAGTLEQAVRARVKELMANDFEFLLQSLYRFDVEESAFHAAMALPSSEEVIVQITRLILQREEKRQYWRKRYPSSASDPNNSSID